ncbi:peptidase M23B [Alkaliphilus metalliredigens QYMF]|uniref:Peptidase M23B n=1 Tax=Alkaliphilus metalliredigens (strain QYMF) TaxID=293826 RepID=A6TSX3_ALKMQ|nr:M23 family metallopeptidase [Alkaliphilus metalliredigens]ABR49291.1 peptidase M23B [Alkaliphilus metalliredigens QYMF]
MLFGEFKHFARPKKKKITLIVIPDATKEVKQYALSLWVPPLIFSSFIILLICTVLFSSVIRQNNLEAASFKNEIHSLEEINFVQASEMALLQEQSFQIQERLSGLDDLQNKVLDMVGLETDHVTSEPEVSFMVSRSDLRTSFTSYTSDELEHLEQLIESQKESMHSLIDNVEEQLQYIDAVPNLMPATGRISSSFGYRNSPFGSRREFHQGIDIANQSNTSILASGSGIVTYSGYNGGYGNMIIINHGYGYTSVYAHNRENLVSQGDSVEKEELIAKMGSTGRSTGPHLHFEIRYNGTPVNPLSIIK